MFLKEKKIRKDTLFSVAEIKIIQSNQSESRSHYKENFIFSDINQSASMVMEFSINLMSTNQE